MAKRRYMNAVWTFAVAFGLVALLALTWLFSSVSNTFRHIMPGGGDSVSTSMEPYDVKLLTAIKGGIPLPENEKPFSWQLKLPRAFVIGEKGSNDSVLKFDKVQFGNHWVTLSADLGPDGKEFVPTVLRPPNKPVTQSFVFELTNSAPGPHTKDFPRCVPRHLEKELLGPLGYVGANDVPCTDRDFRCSVVMYTSGWRISFSVTRDLYADPENACRLATNFLEKYTIHRDEIK